MNKPHTAESVLTLVDRSGDCWEWRGYIGSRGYGQVRFDGKQHKAHRVVAMIHGLIETLNDAPDNCVLHRCDNRKCCRPDHLFVGTRADNVWDMMDKGRHRVVNANRKIPKDAIPVLVARNRAGDSITSLAKECGVARQTLSRCLRNAKREDRA